MDENKLPITEPKDVIDALETIKSIEMFGFALEESTFKPKWFASINKSMDILRHIHDDLVARLPPEVIESERMKNQPPKPSPLLKPNTVPMGVA